MKKEERIYFKDLAKGTKLKKLSDAPIFYHHGECDCVECLTRREKGITKKEAK